MADGIQIRHATAKSQIFLVPMLHKPFLLDSIGNTCPTCQTIHPCKTIHLHLDDSGACLVSEGVLEHLKEALLGLHGLTVEGRTNRPPGITLSQDTKRAVVDHKNRAITRWSGPKGVVSV